LAQVFLGSPGLSGICVIFPPISLASWFTDCGLSLPKLKISPTLLVVAALKNAFATSVA